MKPFLGIDLTENRKNETANGDEFVVSTISGGQTKNLETACEDMSALIEKAELPLPLRILRGVSFFVGFAGIVGILKSMVGEDAVTLAQAYQNAAWLFWLVGVCLLMWTCLEIVSNQKQKDALKANDRLFSKMDDVVGGSYAELGIPAEAPYVDILTFHYKLKNKEPVVKEKGFSLAPYDNTGCALFVQDEALCIASLDKKWAFPLAELRAIRTVRKSIAVSNWTKEEPPEKGYKSYKITTDGYGRVHFKPYHILELEHAGEQWGIYFPCYELPVFEALTGMTAE